MHCPMHVVSSEFCLEKILFRPLLQFKVHVSRKWVRDWVHRRWTATFATTGKVKMCYKSVRGEGCVSRGGNLGTWQNIKHIQLKLLRKLQEWWEWAEKILMCALPYLCLADNFLKDFTYSSSSLQPLVSFGCTATSRSSAFYGTFYWISHSHKICFFNNFFFFNLITSFWKLQELLNKWKIRYGWYFKYLSSFLFFYQTISSLASMWDSL